MLGTVAALALLPVFSVSLRKVEPALIYGNTPVLSEEPSEIAQVPPKIVDGLRLVRPKLSHTQVTDTPNGIFDGALHVGVQLSCIVPPLLEVMVKFCGHVEVRVTVPTIALVTVTFCARVILVLLTVRFDKATVAVPDIICAPPLSVNAPDPGVKVPFWVKSPPTLSA